MFDIGWSEMLVVALVAIVVIGPKDLPAALRQAGKWMGAVRRMASDFQGQVNEAMKEAELDGLRKELQDLKQTASGFTDPMRTMRDEVKGAIEGRDAAVGMPSTSPATDAPIASPELPAPETTAATEFSEPRPADLPLPPTPETTSDFGEPKPKPKPKPAARRPRAKKAPTATESKT